jgi:cytochrome c
MSRRLRPAACLPIGVAAVALALSACTQKSSTPAQSAAPDISAAAPASEAAPPTAPSESAPTAEAAPATPEAAPAATTPAPAGMIPLQIKAASGQPVFGNPNAGRQVFVACSACHSLQPGQNMVGPSLHGIIGRHSGIAPGFHYSSANKTSGLIWTEQELYTYLENPQKTVPGTYMTYIGVKDPQQRADVIAYLQQATK